jgi:hypothetical protein
MPFFLIKVEAESRSGVLTRGPLAAASVFCAVRVHFSIQFSSLLLVCCISSQKANYRCSTRE